MNFMSDGFDSEVRRGLILQGVLKFNLMYEEFYDCPGVEWPQTEQEYCELVTVLAHRAVNTSALGLTLQEWADMARENLENTPVSLMEIKSILRTPLGDALPIQSLVSKFF